MRQTANKHGGCWLCELCHARDVRASMLRKEYGVTLDEYDAWYAQQGGRCAICGDECKLGRWLAIDHDHATYKIRGLLCRTCNVGLGHFNDDVAHLRAAIKYLQQAGSENAE